MLISAFSIVSVRKLILFWTAGPRSLATDPDKVKSTIPVLLGKGSDDRGRPGEGGSPAPISCDLCKITEPMMIEGALKVFWFLPFLNIGTPPPTHFRQRRRSSSLYSENCAGSGPGAGVQSTSVK